MRTKDEIIGHLFDDVKKAKELGTLEHLTDISMLEVFIDIRDILDRKSDGLKAAEIDNDTVKLIHSDKE